MATTTHPKVHCATGSLTLAQVNKDTRAGTIIVPPAGDRTIEVVDGWLRASVANAGGATAVIVTDTAGSPATIVSATAGALTAGTIARFGDTNVTFLTPNAPLTKGLGLKIGCTVANVTTATSIDYCIYYTVTV